MSEISEITWQYSCGKPTMPTVVSYFTDIFYLWCAYELMRSCQAFGLSYYIRGVPPCGDWYDNTNYKPTFLRNLPIQGPMLWVDADGRIRQYPGLFESLDITVAYHVWDRTLPASGTVYLGDTTWRDKLLNTWIEEVAAAPRATDQVCLGRAVRRLDIPFLELPREYCYIFDCSGVSAESRPVIEHMQSNRWVHKKVPFIKGANDGKVYTK